MAQLVILCKGGGVANHCLKQIFHCPNASLPKAVKLFLGKDSIEDNVALRSRVTMLDCW